MTTISVVAAGAMGAAIGARLVANGARVSTTLDGRSRATAKRAAEAGMKHATDRELADADIFLSIVPPDHAEPLARRIARVLKGRALTYVDLNAISPATTRRIGGIIDASGARFVDGGIVGGPPGAAGAGPMLYLSGDADEVAVLLAEFGLRTKALEGGVGTASALKLSYAGITKGTTALGAAMLLAAARAGVADALVAELGDSQRELLARLRKAIPDMLPKARRWSPEMQEIAAFIGAERAEAGVYDGLADFYRALADGDDGVTLDNLIKADPPGG